MTEPASKRCPHCKNRLIQKSADGVRFRIDGPLVVDDAGICHAKCFTCKAEIAIPLELHKSFAIEEERVVVLTRAPKTTTVRK